MGAFRDRHSYIFQENLNQENDNLGIFSLAKVKYFEFLKIILYEGEIKKNSFDESIEGEIKLNKKEG